MLVQLEQDTDICAWYCLFYLLCPFFNLSFCFVASNTEVPQAIKALRSSSFLVLSKGPSWLCKCSYNICTRVKKGTKEMCTRRKQRNNASHDDASHCTCFTHVWHSKASFTWHSQKKERKKMAFRSLGVCDVSSFFFLSLTTLVSVSISVSEV